MPVLSSTMIEVCIFKIEHDRPLYLLLKRRKDELVYPGIWQYITGSIDAGEKATVAALREMKEETGLSPHNFWVVPYVNSFYDAAHDSMNLLPLFAAQVAPGDVPVLSSEHDEFVWMPYNEAWKKLVWPAQREGLRIVHEYIVKGEEAADLDQIL